MGREQKRAFVASVKKKGIAKSVAELYFRAKLYGSAPNELKEGDKVKLNTEAIQKHPDYPRLSEKYRNFVETHTDDVFTVEKDAKRKDTKTLVCLAEDSDKWLFWTGNLILVERSE